MKNQYSIRWVGSLIIVFALIGLLLGSCKKEGDDEEEQSGNGYKITFKVDGVMKEFADVDFPPYGAFYNNGTQYGGIFAATGYATSFGFQVYDTKAIEEKDYNGFVVTPTTGSNSIYGAVISYAVGQLSYSTQSITNPNVQVKFTEITATSVRGEFSGTLKSQNGKPDINITEGKFYAKNNTQ